MRILTRYILKETFSHSLLGLLVFTFVIFIRQLGNLLELVVRHNVPLHDTATLFLLPVPSILMMTIPLAVMVGTLIGLSRMAADGEVIAARATGIGVSAFVRPVMILALTGWAVTLWMALVDRSAGRSQDEPHGNRPESQSGSLRNPAPSVHRAIPQSLLYLEDVTGSRSSWRGVFIADMTQHNQGQGYVSGKRGACQRSRPAAVLCCTLSRARHMTTTPNSPDRILHRLLHQHRNPHPRGPGRSGRRSAAHRPI